MTAPMSVTAPASSVLEISALTIALPPGVDRRHAVENVSLGVDRGEIVCIVGESGAGKSMVAHAVMGLLPPALKATDGRIMLDGEDLLGASRTRLRELRGSRMAMIFQEPMSALNPVVKVGKQIAEVLSAHTVMPARQKQARVLDLMGAVNLPGSERLAEAYPHQLSGGQRQRVMIAAALALKPSLLIADEPTTALDVTTQAQILQLIRDLRQRHGMGVLFITHDFGVVAEIADRVAVMQHGRIVEIGATAAVLRQPSHPYTRMLIASVPSLRPKPPGAAPSDHAVLSIHKISKTYLPTSLFGRREPVVALQDATLKVCRGEVLGVVGESGSGKSTLARCVVRLVDPTSGSLRLCDREIAHAHGEGLRRERRRVQIVFQDPYRSLNPRRTVGQSIVECPVNFGVSEREAWARARELIAFVGLDHKALHRYPHEFSGGQRQRICIARALSVQPELLIADEAVSALDVSVQAQVLRLLDDIRRRFDLAILFITHDLRVAAQVCDRVAVMHRGRVVEEGATADIFNNPREPYTRQLLEAAPGREWDFGAEVAAATY
jgi:peptide/nickel transport system ATP-binding protein